MDLNSLHLINASLFIFSTTSICTMQVVPENDQNSIPTNQGTAESKLERTS